MNTRRFPRNLAWLFTIVLLLGCGDSVASAQTAFPLHTAGQYMVDSNGYRVRLNAFNWYGTESTDYVVAGLQTASLQSIVDEIKSLGFNAVRLPWSNQMYESNPVVGNYALAANTGLEGENALTIFDQVISTLTNDGIMVILDNHMSNAGWCCSTTDGNTLWYNTSYPETSWIADWEGIVQRYDSNPYVIGVDLRNEPRGTATWGGSASTDWHATAQRGSDAIQTVDSNLLVFVEGISYAGDLSGVSSLPISLTVGNRVVHRQNYDLPRNQSDRSVASFAFLSVSNWFHAAPAEASVRIVCPVLLLPSRFALGESCLAATTCRFEGEAPAASLFHY